MYRIYIFFFSFIILSACQTASHQADQTWLTDMATAQQIATKENKAIFMFYTGSDWCMPCKALHQEVLEQPSFLDLAKDKFVLVELDFPSERVEQSEQQKAHNQFWFEKYTPAVYPTIYLCDAQAKRFGQLEGYAEEKKGNYLKALTDILSNKQNAERLENLVSQANGKDKVLYLDSLLSLSSRYLLVDKKAKMKTLLSLSDEDSFIHSKYSRQLLDLELNEVLLPLIKAFGEVKFENKHSTVSELMAISKTSLAGIETLEQRFPSIPEGKALLELISLKINAQFGIGETAIAKKSMQDILKHPSYSIPFKQSFANSFASLLAENGELNAARSIYDSFIDLDSESAVAQQLKNGKVVFFKFLEGQSR